MAKYLAFVLITIFTLLQPLLGREGIHFDRHISLPSNPVFCITQDEKGFVWFGTKNGLLRFDGYSFDVFNSIEGDSTTINNDWVWSLYNDTQGNIWVGTGFGLNIWIPEENGFRNIDLPLENASTNSLIVRKIFEDKSGRLWIGTNYGLYSGKSNDHRFNKYELHFDLSQSTNFDIKEISEDLDGNILISSQYGIFSLENDRPTEPNLLLNSILTSESHSDEIRTVFSDRLNGTLWIGTQSQNTALIRCIEGFAPEIIDLPGSLETNSIRAIRNFGDSKLWLGTMNGLIIYDTITYSKTTLLEYQSVRDIFKDNEGGIWIATYNDGIYYQSSRAHWFQHVTGQPNIRGSAKGQRDNVVNDMVKVDNQIWMATEFGLKLYDPSQKTVSLYPGINREGIGNNRLKCLVFQDDRSLLWMGTFNGLASLNIKTGELQNFNSSLNESPGSWMEIYDIVVIDNEVWAGTNNRGLICISKNGLIDQYADHFNKSANHINALHVAPDKTLWVGSNAGLSAIDPETKRLRRIGSENYFFKSENIISISQDEKGNLWLGTERSGLIYFSTKTLDFRFIRKEHGLLSNKIKSVEVDNRGHLWVTTDEGLSEIILSGTDDFSSISFEIFDFAIQSEGGSPYFLVNSSYRTPEGDMLYGTRNGFLIFSPDKVQNRRWYPKVWIKDISINQEHIMKDKRLIKRFGSVEELTSLELDNDESVLSIDFGGINYSQTDQLYYSYMLVGVDNEWQPLHRKRNLSYSFLPPGEYQLRLKASNSNQKWGDSFTALNIKIHPPFYKSKVAFLIYLFTILFLLYLFYRYSSRWQRMKNQLVIEELDKNKEHELHQLKSEFFMNISHELRTPLMLILEPVEDLLAQNIDSQRIRNRLRAVRRNAQKMLSLANQIVDIRKIETSSGILRIDRHDIIKFVKAVSHRFNELSRLKNIDFRIIASDEKLEVWFDVFKLDKAISNILSNAFKYTKENGEITISVGAGENDKTLADEAFIIIEDNGKGIAEEDIVHLFDRFHHLSNQDKRLSIGDGIGLDLAKKVIDLHQGEIKVESLEENENAHGLTRITISLKLGNEHFNSEDIIDSENDTAKDKKDLLVRYNYETINPNNENGSMISSDYTILIVDNDIHSRETLRELFSKSYHVYEVADGLEGWKLVIDIIPNLIILTENVTTIDTHELCQRIKIDERTCHIPVVIIADQIETHQVEFSADEYLEGHLDMEYLKQKADYLIEQRERVRRQFEKNSILKPTQVSSYDEKLLNNAIEFIDENLSDPNLSIERISKEIGISRVHFYRKIKSLLGMSPIEFVRTYRIRKAGQLLEQKKLNVSDVRMMVGFNDSDYFRSCFKKEYGLTPSEFIKKSFLT